ncbi:hypothetical protein V5P93_001048 [Actinokineospora auranticolor]|uniref:Uncharacterized protein n=1 Tax=Actinokineospora auranticolor TaxID=155976 RepID=A0A2S6GDZ6_9PSEU|nr:hypothetical protein [Actinokineospora auranticolor]PPK63449.1 hypothetical protein CLV40_12862 [Actinokineospora auranticolor]
MTLGNPTNQVVSGEDVLDGDVPPAPVRVGPRHGFNRRRDWVLLLVVIVALVAGLVLVWQTSEVNATESRTTDVNPGYLAQPEVFPPSLGEAWRAKSPATWQPVVVGIDQNDQDIASTVVTGDGGEVAGRDPRTGDVRWTYRRGLDLCTIGVSWKKVIAVYRTGSGLLPSGDPRAEGGCSEITALKPTSGERDRQRHSDAELGTKLLDDGVDYATFTGSKLLLSLRSDLVKTLEYGTVAAKVNPGKQPRTDCEFHTVLTTPGKVAVVESCPDETTDRLTVLRAAPAESDKPEEVTSLLLDGRGAQVVAMNNTLTAVALPDPGRVVVYNEQGQVQGTYPVELGSSDLRADPPGHSPLVSTATATYHWYTGSRTVVLSAIDLSPLRTVPDTLGPGVVFAGRALLPVANGLVVIDQASGDRIGTIPVDREGYSGPVTMSTVGPVVLEQRGDTVVALH